MLFFFREYIGQKRVRTKTAFLCAGNRAHSLKSRAGVDCFLCYLVKCCCQQNEEKLVILLGGLRAANLRFFRSFPSQHRNKRKKILKTSKKKCILLNSLSGPRRARRASCSLVVPILTVLFFAKKSEIAQTQAIYMGTRNLKNSRIAVKTEKNAKKCNKIG